MVEALDKMLGDALTSELNEFAEDKKAAIEAKVEYQRQIKEHAYLFDAFVMSTQKKSQNYGRS